MGLPYGAPHGPPLTLVLGLSCALATDVESWNSTDNSSNFVSLSLPAQIQQESHESMNNVVDNLQNMFEQLQNSRPDSEIPPLPAEPADVMLAIGYHSIDDKVGRRPRQRTKEAIGQVHGQASQEMRGQYDKAAVKAVHRRRGIPDDPQMAPAPAPTEALDATTSTTITTTTTTKYPLGYYTSTTADSLANVAPSAAASAVELDPDKTGLLRRHSQIGDDSF
eukprot:gnl/MRDRNA2_/MRDRNA2_98814_c0_seq1.p1 gnl/MRDRNA2_/MRDRNA2_98814_c0~~gnl/MRDRNA2_/MRDRNA2_98814_c0_seq1.p1  ORF type:complete len:222 (-),score=37.15 gnl/MRDRNA2_/MRDRNA2_98814_c0_seq1:37-702(-)